MLKEEDEVTLAEQVVMLKKSDSRLLFVNDENGTFLDEEGGVNDATFIKREYESSVSASVVAENPSSIWRCLCIYCCCCCSCCLGPFYARYFEGMRKFLWRKRWVLSLVAWLIVFSLLAWSIVLMTSWKSLPLPVKKQEWNRVPANISKASNRFQLEDFTRNRGNWMPIKESIVLHPFLEGLMFEMSQNGDLVLVQVESKQVEQVLIPKSAFETGITFSLEEIKPSPKNPKLLAFPTASKIGWRYSRTSHYVIWDGFGFHDVSDGETFISTFQWSPSGTAFSFVNDNNLYVGFINQSSDGFGSSAINYHKVTLDGSPEIIFNGHTDWAYEEEIFNSDLASFWSIDGTFLAFVKFNDTNVRYFPYTTFTVIRDNYYPEVKLVRYPNAGTPNPIVTLHIFHLESRKLLDVSDYSLQPGDLVLREFLWLSDSILIFRQLNRIQNLMYLSKVDLASFSPSNGTTDLVNLELIRTVDLRGKKGFGWFDTTDCLTRIKIGDKLFFADLENDRTGYNQLFLSPINDRENSVALTDISGSAKFEVIKVFGFDEANRRLWFLANERGPNQRHLYYLELDEQGAISRPMTFYSGQREPANYNAKFSAQFGYSILDYQGPEISHISIHKVVLPSDGRGWSQNLSKISGELADRLKKVKLPTVKYFSIAGETKDDDDLMVKMFYPPDFDPKASKKYPVLIRAYGGPLSTLTIMQDSVSDWSTHLSSAQDIIVASVDGRGTDGRGRRFRWAIYQDLGNKEVTDQLLLAKHLSEKPYIDERLIAIQGWSYGGYVAAKTLERNNPLIRIGISVALVYSWQAYDSLYTERYMGPLVSEDDRNRYKRSQVQVKGDDSFNDLLLIQGTADDNVHFLNSMLFEMDLVDSDVFASVQQRVFADSNHGIFRGNDRHAVHQIMTEFLLDKFEMKSRQHL